MRKRGGGGGADAAAKDPGRRLGSERRACRECACALHLRGRDGAVRLRPLPLPPILLPFHPPSQPVLRVPQPLPPVLPGIFSRLGTGWGWVSPGCASPGPRPSRAANSHPTPTLLERRTCRDPEGHQAHTAGQVHRDAQVCAKTHRAFRHTVKANTHAQN